MTDDETKQWAEYGQAMAAYQRAEADRKAAEDARLAEAQAAHKAAVRRWAGMRAAEKRWGKDRPRTTMIRAFVEDAAEVQRLAKSLRVTCAEVLSALIHRPRPPEPSGDDGEH